MKVFYYPALFQPDEGKYVIEVPDVPGCMTQADTLEEATGLVQDVIGVMLEGTKPDDYPAPSRPEELSPESGQFVMVVPFDPVAYNRRAYSRAVKKTLTIPDWLNRLALERNINFSNVLQNALMRELGVASA